ncbi:MAG TPA: ZIP family metal transporter [Clostridiaceae bacterium]|jgi:ZIP family zinc transporter|nr:ZIP family metal transporter [Clostridiaceae bacterium]
MDHLLKITLIGLLSGIAGTSIGGLIGIFLDNISKPFFGFILEFSAGLMTSVVCFELIPEALKLSSTSATFSGLFLGIIVILIIEKIIDISFSSLNNVRSYKNKNKYKKKNTDLLRTGILVAVGIALHNLPEGFAVGSGFQASVSIGTAITAVIIIHDIPEGIAMALPMKTGGYSKMKALIYTILSGIPMGIGAFLGAVLSGISDFFIGACLGFAAGAMLYIVYVNLVPESKKIYLGRFSSIGNLLGIICGIIITTYG